MKRWLFILIPLVILGGLITWRIGQANAERDEQKEVKERRATAPKPVSVVPVRVRDIVTTYNAVGTVESPDNVEIAPEVTGRIEALTVTIGDPVRRGQVVARIDPSQVEAEVRRQEASVAEARYRLAQARINTSPAVVAILSEIRRQEVALAEAQNAYKQALASDRAQRSGALAGVTDATGRIRNAQAGIASEEATFNQSKESYAEQIAAAQAAVTDAQGRVKSAEAGIASAQADLGQSTENYAGQVAAAQALVTDAQGRITAAEAGISSAQADIRSAQADLDNAKTKYNRTYALYKQAFIAAQEVDDARAAVKVAQAALDSAEQQLESAKALKSSAQAQKQAAQKQADIVATKGKADIEVARTRVAAAQAARDSANAQKEAAEKQVSIARTKGNADVEVARSKVAQARAARDSTEAQRRAAQEQVTVIGSKSDVDIEAARSRVSQAQASLREARSNMALKSSSAQNLAALQSVVDAAEAELRAVRSRLSDTILTSPIDGVVTARRLDPGAIAGPGQPIITVQSLRQVWVLFPTPEEISRQIAVGQIVQVAFDGLPNRTFNSRISRINPAADLQSRQFSVRLTLDNPQNLIKPGMFARINLVTQRVSNAIVVPREAVERKEGETQNGTVVVINKNSETEKRNVTLGADDPKGFQIIEGIMPGEKVVVMSTTPLRPGQEVKTGEKQTEKTEKKAD
ncbi:MAG TPA: efflux RND transporter periplasmic adaptor subunit [Abditibacteriaceae bacterium]